MTAFKVVVDLAVGDTVDCVFTNVERVDYGDAPNTYGTTQTTVGAAHRISSTLWLGAIAPDAEGIPTTGADGDDLDNTDDEDGVAAFPPPDFAATTYSVDVLVNKRSSNMAFRLDCMVGLTSTMTASSVPTNLMTLLSRRIRLMAQYHSIGRV